MAMRGEPKLILASDGFSMKSPFSTRFFPWAECYDFHVRRTHGLDFICFSRRGYGSECAIVNLYDAPTATIVRSLEERSTKVRGAAQQAVAADGQA
jgi:hypothetical protein